MGCLLPVLPNLCSLRKTPLYIDCIDDQEVELKLVGAYTNFNDSPKQITLVLCVELMLNVIFNKGMLLQLFVSRSCICNLTHIVCYCLSPDLPCPKYFTTQNGYC